MKTVARHRELKCCLLAVLLFIPATFSLGQKVTRIEILNAELTAFDQKIGRDARKLLGNVQLKHEDVVMSCDSAYFYPSTGSVDAFSNIRIIQGDTMTLTGDLLHYNGNTKIAEVRDHVRLVDKETTLRTDYLYYDRPSKLAYYMGGGVLTKDEDRLTSGKGYFYLDTEVFIFKDSVVVTNPDYTIHADTLRYDTNTEISYFYGPTEIISEGRYIYCENGWYDSRQDVSLVTDHARLEEEGRTLRGDTLYYEAEQGFGRARSNVELTDTAENLTLRGQYGIYYRDKDSAMITDSALMIQVEGTDTMYVHADTLRSIQNPVKEDTSRILRAYYRVKIFRPDIQVMCDSLEYVEADSVFRFFGEPVLWSEENQLTANRINVVMKDQQLYRMYLEGTALVVSRKDSSKFDQMRGKEMMGYFQDNKLMKIDVTGNGQTIYYAEDRDVIVGVNKTFCSDLIIYLRDNKIVRVNYMKKPDGTYYPLELLPQEEALLADFKWVEQWRPLNYMDVFRWK
jgi:lipopolysaccharide export system protein LptA